MASKMKQHKNTLIAVIKTFGITDFYFETRKKHDSIVVTHKRQTRRHIFSVSPSDSRSTKNSQMDLRRMLRELTK